jgi:signal recognition particle subunit SRP54
MEELRQIRAKVEPSEILLVADAMTGQDAVTVSESFNEALDITGVILTKMDGDARGGAALSILDVTGKPIKLVGMGEKLDPLEPVHPERIASRILGMGDILTLIEKAEQEITAEQAEEMQQKLLDQTFTLEDFREQLGRLKKMGSFEELMKMIPGMSGMKQLKGMQPSEKEINQIDAIISSMTPDERARPQIISGRRRQRIAKGSGTNVNEVNKLLKQFGQMQKMMKSLTRKKGRMPFGLGNLPFG